MRGGRSVHSGRSCMSGCFACCRRTALHWASENGCTETAMALVKVGADVHCKANNGYGFSGCIVVSLGCQKAGRTARPLEVEMQECRLGSAG